MDKYLSINILRHLERDHSLVLEVTIISSISSCECKKLVSDVLGEIECFTDVKSTAKMAHFEPYCKSPHKVFTFLC